MAERGLLPLLSSFLLDLSLTSAFIHSDYFEDKMNKETETENSSAVDSENLGETTDVLNMVITSCLFRYELCELEFPMNLYVYTFYILLCVKADFVNI